MGKARGDRVHLRSGRRHGPLRRRGHRIGYRDRFLFSIVLQESIVLSVLGFIPGYAIAEVLYLVARHNAHVPVEMTLARALGVFGLTVFMCVASGSIAMRKLTSADPAEIF
ncbi:MAG: hypothetical protein DMF85_05440 [Acidobacteria bacterium]|nr:MAG: hypothetical protein DMF85_05440 [Acidobacteriota bacterium]